MTIYYVDGVNGNDGSNGTTWNLAKKTLNGAEDIPVAAGDTVYVGPGVYREELLTDVDGGAGNVITYIADISGENTDQVGGIVRITGSDNDQTAARTECVTCAHDYRTFRGFSMDTTSSTLAQCNGDTNIFEDCVFSGDRGIACFGPDQANSIIRRCLFLAATVDRPAMAFFDSSTVDDTGHLVENCILIGGHDNIRVQRVGGITIKNCVLLSASDGGVDITTALSVGQTVTINNCILAGADEGLKATVLGEIVEDYNTFWGNATDRTNVAVGANSQVYAPIFALPVLLDGFALPVPLLGSLSQWSPLRAIAGTSESSDDFFGFTRPATSAKKSWGAVQVTDFERDTTTPRTGTASLVLNDAGRVQMFVPVTNISTTISVYVNREGGYTGSNPQMIIKQPGQADRTTTDAGADSTWNQLTDTFTPAADPPYVIVELVSQNTASAGLYSNFAVYFDDLDVS